MKKIAIAFVISLFAGYALTSQLWKPVIDKKTALPNTVPSAYMSFVDSTSVASFTSKSPNQVPIENSVETSKPETTSSPQSTVTPKLMNSSTPAPTNTLKPTNPSTHTPKPTNSPTSVPKSKTSSKPTPVPKPVISPSPVPTEKSESTGEITLKTSNGSRTQSQTQIAAAQYLMDYGNRESVKDAAMALNNGNQRNSCVYFVSETLRRIGLNMPKTVCNTGKLNNEDKKSISLSYQLISRGWKVSRDLSLLLSGDICFTTLSEAGKPTHAYMFIGWVKEGSYDYAYICDNQSYDYGKTLHIRNVKIAVNGKDAFNYFMYLPN